MTRALLLDTHAAIWFVEARLSFTALATVRAAGDAILVSPVSAWEIGLLARPRGDRPPRLDLQPDPATWFALLLQRPLFTLAPLTPEMAIAASFLPGDFHSDPADRMLVATARALDVPILTRDRLILDYARQGHVEAIAC